ncbi:MAG: hypothetical protein RM022_014450 [Nostoc sp. EfeVER01]|nr:hypothetical protein [Nostoc sp. EfeVER01]MDZ7945413.1 hypothetical protein [Nostoc sp. EfeVER01]MDZ7993376.1 hypothetical protein [Nostoc sp. EspVER01]
MYNISKANHVRVWNYLLQDSMAIAFQVQSLNQQLEFRGMRSHSISLYL